MAPARCSSCHCYMRSCPDGLPNHKHCTAVGQNCTMNSQGRHFRVQDCLDEPSCDYEYRAGAPCTFFTSGEEFSSLPYPTDVSLGPINADNAPTLQTIMDMLLEQKESTRKLQAQVNSLTSQPPQHNGDRNPGVSGASNRNQNAPPPSSTSNGTGHQNQPGMNPSPDQQLLNAANLP